MNAPFDDRITFRCPWPDCGQAFRDPDLRPGTFVSCRHCGRAMNARPVAMETELDERERRAIGGPGDPTRRRLPLAALADNVRSLWNVGSMFRTSDGCGVSLLVLTGVTGCPPRDAIAKTALGAERAVPWRYRARELDAVHELLHEGWSPVAVENGPASIPIWDFDWPARPCLVVGNEIRGVSPHVLAACTVRVAIPMLGAKETLNVAVAYGIAAFRAAEVLRARAKTK